MKEKIKKITNSKIFHLCMISVIIIGIISFFIFLSARYDVKGETKMPFNISKISVISSVEGIDAGNAEKKWSFNINQNNDIYIYIENDEKNSKEEIIESIKIENIQVKKQNEIGTVKIYRPDKEEEKIIFKNIPENEIADITFEGDIKSDLKNFKISNQGGIIAFRYSNNEIAQYSSDEEQINHNELLKKANIQEDLLKAELQFDLIMKLNEGKIYKTNISLQMPVENIVEQGTTSREITDTSNFIFKRLNN